MQVDSFTKTEKLLHHLPSRLAFMELRGKRGSAGCQDPRGQGMGFGIAATGTPVSTIITAVRQQDYSASVWLRRREKLEHVSSQWWKKHSNEMLRKKVIMLLKCLRDKKIPHSFLPYNRILKPILFPSDCLVSTFPLTKLQELSCLN